MVNFVSTFPPIVCGIGSYTDYLTKCFQPGGWSVTSFRLDQLSKGTEAYVPNAPVTYDLTLETRPFLPGIFPVVWFQHAFGMWGKEIDAFSSLVVKAKGTGAKVIGSFHTIHFESGETESGLCAKEEHLMSCVLPLFDAVTVFSDGAFRALCRAFPLFRKKIAVLRHGVHQYPLADLTISRERLLAYLATEAAIPAVQKQQIRRLAHEMLSPGTVLIGNVGFVSHDKDPLSLYDLGERLRRRLPGQKLITMYIGKVQDRRDKNTAETEGLVRRLRSLHDGKQNLFFEDYLPERMLPSALGSLDVCAFWCRNATQSGRMAHALGTSTCIVGRRLEGLGETLDLASLPAAIGLEDLADKAAALILDPTSKGTAVRQSREYACRYSFENQARKHLLLMDAVKIGHKLPLLDRAQPDVTFILPGLAIGSRIGLEDFDDGEIAFLNVADDGDLNPLPTHYHRIPLRDGTSIPPEKMKAAVKWIKKTTGGHKVVVFCRYGRGRSASIVIGYLCIAAGMVYSDAVEIVSRKRAGIAPLPSLDQTIEMVRKHEG